MPVAYAAIGASAAEDLMRFPPAESVPYEQSQQIGSGSERFLTAANLLMTWGAHRAAGVGVRDIVRGEAGEYLGVRFGSSGAPELGDAPEELFTPEGVAYIQPGTTATLEFAGRDPRPVMVISTIDEPQRLGFAWGDREEGPGYGEHLMIVEHRADGTVWAIVRGFVFPTSSGLLASFKQRGELREVTELAEAFLAALQPGAALRKGVVPEGSSATATLDSGGADDGEHRAADPLIAGETDAEAKADAEAQAEAEPDVEVEVGGAGAPADAGIDASSEDALDDIPDDPDAQARGE